MQSYSKAPDDATDRVLHLLKLFYPELVQLGIKVDLLTISDDEDDEGCLKLHGYPCNAVIRVVDVKSRIMGRGDVEIVIDEQRYLRMNDAEKDALLDHELHHIEIKKRGKKGTVVRDEANRPKIGMKLHDREFGWFDAIAQRHGINSAEIQQAHRLILSARDVYFEFLDNPANAEVLELED